MLKAVFKERSRTTTLKHIEALAQALPSVVMIGTSMLERFQYDPAAEKIYRGVGLDKLDVFNAGVGGDRLSNILYRLQNLELLKHIRSVPKLVILEAGANDVDKKNMDFAGFLDGITQLIHVIRQRWPDTAIAVIGVFPRLSENCPADQMLQRIRRVNAETLIVCQREDVTFYDWSNDVLNEDGTAIDEANFVDDVHFSEQGYLGFANRLLDLITSK